MTTALIADDEPHLARALAEQLARLWPELQVVHTARNGVEAAERIAALRPDLAFLDIQMPGLTGFEVLEALTTPLPQIIFSTAFDQYAMDAFEAAAVDYLLKPYDEARLKRALDRAINLQGAGQGGDVKALMHRAAQIPLERLLVEGDKGLEALPLRAIFRLEADGKLVRVHTEKGVFELRRALKDLEARLPGHRFVRIHRGTLVALEAVVRLEPWDHGDGLLILRDGSHCVLSRTYRATFLEQWGMEG